MTTVGGKFTVQKRNLVTYVEKDLYEKLREKASSHQRSVSAEAAWVIRNYVAPSQLEVSRPRQSEVKQVEIVKTKRFAPVIDKIVQQLESFSADMQRKVLSYTEVIGTGRVKGRSGKSLLQFCGSLDKDKVSLIREVIESDDFDE